MKILLSLKQALLVTVLVLICGMAPATSPCARALSISIGEPAMDRQVHKTGVTGDDGIALFLFGAFCALWAQNTGRNAWLWFFLGLFFSVISVVVLLNKNSTDNFDRKVYGRTTRDLRP